MAASGAAQVHQQVRRLLERGEADRAQALVTEALPGASGDERATLLLCQALVHNHRGELAAALAASVQAGQLHHDAGSTLGACDALTVTAGTLRAAGDLASALSTLEQAEPLAREAGDDLRLSRVLRQIGVVSSLLRRHQHAHACLEEAGELLHRPDERGEWRTTRQSALNAVARQMQDLPAEATPPSAHEAHLADWQLLADEAQAAGEVRTALMCLGNRAIQLQHAGRAAESAAALRALIPRYREHGMRPNEALAHAELAHALERQGLAAEARSHYLQGLALLRGGPATDELLQSLEGLARCEERLGDIPAAYAALTELRATERQRRDEAARQALLQRELRIELARLTNQWARQATSDPLTGLANRRALEHWLADHWARVERGHPLAVVLLDLDHFKQINDTLGHAAGDEVLRAVAAVLRGHSRGGDLAVRYGGEEFLLALADSTLALAAPMAERLRAALQAEPWSRIAPTLRVTASVGVADAHQALDSSALLALADRRLYAAKLGGRNRVVVDG